MVLDEHKAIDDVQKVILVVDDERHVALYLRTLLKRNGYEKVHQAANGEEALAIARDQRPDLILLDLNMPRMDGFRCLEALRKEGVSAKILILTAMASEKAVQECRESGADGFLRKDSSGEDMMRAVRRAFAE